METVWILVGMGLAVGLFVACAADKERQPVVDTGRMIFAVVAFLGLAPVLFATL